MRGPVASPRALAALRTIRRRFGIPMTPEELTGLADLIGPTSDANPKSRLVKESTNRTIELSSIAEQE